MWCSFWQPQKPTRFPLRFCPGASDMISVGLLRIPFPPVWWNSWTKKAMMWRKRPSAILQKQRTVPCETLCPFWTSVLPFIWEKRLPMKRYWKTWALWTQRCSAGFCAKFLPRIPQGPLRSWKTLSFRAGKWGSLSQILFGICATFFWLPLRTMQKKLWTLRQKPWPAWRKKARWQMRRRWCAISGFFLSFPIR